MESHHKHKKHKNFPTNLSVTYQASFFLSDAGYQGSHVRIWARTRGATAQGLASQGARLYVHVLLGGIQAHGTKEK